MNIHVYVYYIIYSIIYIFIHIIIYIYTYRIDGGSSLNCPAEEYTRVVVLDAAAWPDTSSMVMNDDNHRKTIGKW